MSEVVYGIHVIEALLERQPERFLQVYILKGREDHRIVPLINKFKQHGITVQMVSRQWLDKETADAIHQGIVAKIKPGRQYQESDLVQLLEHIQKPLILVLDGITDPHNLGACLRSADAAGVDLVIVPKDRSAQLNATVKKVSSGAADIIPLIRVTNLARTMRLLKQHDIWLVGTAGEAEQTLYQSHLTGSLGLIMGSEGEGLRRLTREHCDELVKIPMQGGVSSLNVSVATGVCLFEILRQRLS